MNCPIEDAGHTCHACDERRRRAALRGRKPWVERLLLLGGFAAVVAWLAVMVEVCR